MYRIHVQYAVQSLFIPRPAQIRAWSKAILAQEKSAGEITIRIVNLEEITHLNETYRHKKEPTNVLSFPSSLPIVVAEKTKILGDIAICAEIVNQEAKEQHKSQEAHWAHMVVHGILHLLGFDHVQPDQALEMETKEIKIIKSFGYPNPYQ